MSPIGQLSAAGEAVAVTQSREKCRAQPRRGSLVFYVSESDDGKSIRHSKPGLNWATQAGGTPPACTSAVGHLRLAPCPQPSPAVGQLPTGLPPLPHLSS